MEIGWRLSKDSWGKGYATEAAQTALMFAFADLDLDEVVAFTTVGNQRSQHVMTKIGMTDSGHNFMHPDIDTENPQCEHVLYKISRKKFFEE